MQSHSSGRTRLLLRTLLLMVISGMLSSTALAQRTINETDRVVLHGNVHPQARAEFDRGSANAAMAMNRMVLLLSVRPDAQAELQQLLADQQNPKSPSYHTWHAFARTMGWPVLHPQAFWNSGMFCTTPFAR